LNDALPADQQQQIGWIVSRTTDPTHTAEIARAIDRVFDERDVQTLSQDERAFSTGFIGMISSVLDVVAVLSGAILVIMALVLANAIGMSVRERVREHGALKALGFSAQHVARLVLIESGLIALGGALLGLMLAYLLVDRGMSDFFELNLAWLFPVFRVDLAVLLGALAASVTLSLAAALIPAFAAGRVSAIEALRRVA
jgi:putative ABC transport system permease protein